MFLITKNEERKEKDDKKGKKKKVEKKEENNEQKKPYTRDWRKEHSQLYPQPQKIKKYKGENEIKKPTELRTPKKTVTGEDKNKTWAECCKNFGSAACGFCADREGLGDSNHAQCGLEIKEPTKLFQLERSQ